MRQYMTVNALSEETGISKDTIRRWIREMRECDRYDADTTFFGGGRTTLVRTVCLLDYSKYRQDLQSPVLRKYVPELKELEIERKMGVAT